MMTWSSARGLSVTANGLCIDSQMEKITSILTENFRCNIGCDIGDHVAMHVSKLSIK